MNCILIQKRGKSNVHYVEGLVPMLCVGMHT